MKKLLTLLLAMMLIMALAVGVATAQERSTLDIVRERGVLIAGVKDSVVPFGFVDEAARDLVGFDVDICRYIADELGVDLELKPVTSSNRIPMLTDGQVDILAATMTHKMERDEVIDFSITYFMDGQRLLTSVDSGITSYEDLAGLKVGSVKGSTSEKNILDVQPDCEVVSFEGYPEAFLALRQGKVVAVTTDSVILVGLKGSDPEPENWVIVGDAFSIEPYGLGLPENDSEWRDFVNFTLIKIWLGPDTNYSMPLTWEMEIWP
jgi:polar amino acid transport system substrate-binding protein